METNDPNRINLVDGKYGIGDIVDLEQLQRIFERFTEATGLTIGFLDHPGLNILIATGWRDICTKFHRSCATAEAVCLKSNQNLLNQLDTPGQAVIELCDNGLVDCAIPIIIKGKHIASLATGQLFLHEPDLERFKAQARLFGFDERAYLQAVAETPVVNEEKLKCATALLGEIAGIITQLGYTNLALRHEGEQLVAEFIEHWKAEAELKESEAWYRTIFENTGTAMIVVEEDTTISLANTEFENLTGFTKEEIEGKISWRVFAPEEDLEKMMTQHKLRRVQQAAALRNYEVGFICKDGRKREIHLTVDMIQSTKKSIASLLDVTDRRQADETLRESQRKLADIIEFFPDATLVIDKWGKITAWNRAMEVLTGIKAEDMLGKGDYEYAIPFHGSRIPILIDFVMDRSRKKEAADKYINILAEGEVIRGEGPARNLSPGDRYCSATAIALHDSKGQIVAAIECIRDITEQKRIEDRLNRAEKMEALGTLAGGVAHDLNNVLGVLVGYSELLMETLPEGSPQKGYAQNILQSSERGAAIIQDLLTMARRGVSVAEVVNLNRVIVDYLNSPEHEKLKSYHQHTQIRTELAEDLFNVKGSPIHLIKTIMNLVSNAAESITDAGIITIRTENRNLDYAVSGYDHMQEGDYVVLCVSDTGGGIPEKDLGKIFEPFYTKKVMGRSGTGLGLAVVWGTVKDHRGFIDVKSEEGVGSTFTLYFPVTREELIGKREKFDIARYRGRGESILVIDDMEFQRELAINLVGKLNYEVSAVSSGEAAVEYLKTGAADLLLLDMLMEPGIDGLETFQRVLEVKPDQKAIIVSGFAEDERVRQALELGAGEYVRKPYNLEKIGLAIRRELDRKDRGR